MVKAAIAQLSAEQRKNFIDDIKAAFADNSQKSILVEALEILDRLLTGNITIAQLRQLFGVELEKLQKKHAEKK
jgi:hypothetical protein